MKKFIWWGLGILAAGLGAWLWFSRGKSTSTNSRLDPTGTAGNKRGERNNNPCNLTPLSDGTLWQGQTGVDTSGDTPYVIFGSPVKGIRAAGVNALNYYYKDGITTLEGFKRWGPKSSTTYGEDLAATIGIDANATFDVPNNLESLLKAISINENSEVPYSESDWQDGVAAALSAKDWGS